MKQELDYSGYAERYLDGVMSPEEQTWFEKELEGNAELNKELDLHRKINRALSEKEITALEAQLDTIYRETYRPLPKIPRIPEKGRKILAYGTASLAGIVLLAWIAVSLISRRTSGTELYAEYYQPAEINMSFRAAEDMVDSDLRRAMLLYEEEKYAEAISLFEKILEQDDSRIGLNLYSGISYMELEEYAQANRNFQRIIDQQAMAFLESAEWYLGLCYLMTEETGKAEEIFRQIASGDGFYKKDAKRILKNI